MILAIAAALGLLMMPTSAFSSGGVSFIETELRSTSTADRLHVATKYPIGDAEKLAKFPQKLGNYSMTHQYQWDSIAELLDTDVLLARDYRAPGLYLPVTLLIVQSTNMSSFHPAPVCYKAQGYTILDDHTETTTIPVTNGSWARSGLFSGDNREFNGTIEAKRLVVEKIRKDNATTRELNLYFYIKEETALVTEKVAWVRMSMFVPATGDYSAHEEVLKHFAAEVVPELFDPAAAPEQQSVAHLLLARLGG